MALEQVMWMPQESRTSFPPNTLGKNTLLSLVTPLETTKLSFTYGVLGWSIPSEILDFHLFLSSVARMRFTGVFPNTPWIGVYDNSLCSHPPLCSTNSPEDFPKVAKCEFLQVGHFRWHWHNQRISSYSTAGKGLGPHTHFRPCIQQNERAALGTMRKAGLYRIQ